MGIHGLNVHTTRGSRDCDRLSSAWIHFRLQYQRWCHSHIATTLDIDGGGKSHQYTGTVQIGGLESIRTVSKRGLGMGNRGMSPRQPLQELKEMERVGASTPLVEDRVLDRGRVHPSQTRMHTTMHS